MRIRFAITFLQIIKNYMNEFRGEHLLQKITLR